MKKLFIPLAILLVCVFIITGCGTSSPTTKPAATTPSATTVAATTPAATVPSATKPTTAPPATTAPSVTTPAATSSAKYGGVLRYIEPMAPGSPIGWPALSSGGGNQFALQPLIKEQKGGSFTPCLATSWEIDSGTEKPSITFHLRKGVKYHDGTDFNAQAMKWNLDHMVATGMNKGSTTVWKSIEVLDDYTLRVNYTEFLNRNTRTFQSGVVFNVSPAAYEKNGVEWMKWNMVGTGPFTQKDFQRDVSMTLDRYANYWEAGKPYLDQIQLLYVTDQLTQQALFKSGGAEILTIGSNGRVANEMKALGYEILDYPGRPAVLTPDSANADSPWSNLKVREAVEYAIDKDGIVSAFGFGYWQATHQINPPASIAYDATITGRKYDPAKAKQLLAEAGYPNGFKTRIIVATGLRDIATAVQANLLKVGIQAELELPEPAKLADYMMGNWKNGLLLNELQQWWNPNDAFVYYFGTPPTYFKNVSKPAEWADLLKASVITPTPEAALTQKLEKAIYDDVIVIPLYFGASMWALTDKVHDTYLGTRGHSAWWEPQNAWLSK